MTTRWWQERRDRKVAQERARRRLVADYEKDLATQDADALESGRDYGDNDMTPWKTEASMGLAFLGMIALFVVVAVLIAFFAAIKALTN